MSANASADPEKVMYLSMALNGGAMERFSSFDEAVAHASALVETDHHDRTIFIAVPRARVRMAPRVDPVDPPPVLTSDPTALANGSAGATAEQPGEQPAELAPEAGSDAAAEHSAATSDHKPIGQVKADLEAVTARLAHARLDYEQARSKGDEERIQRFKIQMSAVEAEHQRLKKYLSRRLAANS